MASAAPAGVSHSKPELWGRGSRDGASEKVAVGESLWREELLHHAADLGGRAGRVRAHGGRAQEDAHAHGASTVLLLRSDAEIAPALLVKSLNT